MQWVKQSASKLEWAKLPLAYTAHILFHVISTYIQEFSESSTKWKWSFEALEIKARYLNSFYCPATAFPVSPEPTSNGFLFGIFFDCILRTQVISSSSSKPLLIWGALSQQPQKQDPQHIHNICSAAVLGLCAGFCSGGYRGGSSGKLLEAAPTCDRAIASRLQDAPGQGQAVPLTEAVLLGLCI